MSPLVQLIHEKFLIAFDLVGKLPFLNLEKNREYDIFLRARASQSISSAANPNEILVGFFSSKKRFRTKEDGMRYSIEFHFDKKTIMVYDQMSNY